MFPGKRERVGSAADGVVDEHPDGDGPRVRRRVGMGNAAGLDHPFGHVDRFCVGERERDGDADAAGGVGGDADRFFAREEEVPARGVHGAVGEPELLVHVHPGKGGRVGTLRVGAVGEHPGDEEHHLGVVGELPGFQPGVRVPPPRPAVPLVEALEVGRGAFPRHAEGVADGGPEETALELIEHLNSISRKIPLKGCYSTCRGRSRRCCRHVLAGGPEIAYSATTNPPIRVPGRESCSNSRYGRSPPCSWWCSPGSRRRQGSRPPPTGILM